MSDIKNVTVTIWVNPTTIVKFMQSMSIIDSLEMQTIENCRDFVPKDFAYSDTPVKQYVQLNVPLTIWIKMSVFNN